ncbi:MAG: polysaccharide deacetylase family protein [bacterium]
MNQKTLRNKIAIVALVFCATIILPTISNVTSAATQPNLIRNPSVEEIGSRIRGSISRSVPSGWQVEYDSENQNTVNHNLSSFYYPLSGHNSRRAIAVRVLSYKNPESSTGAWFFDEVSIDPLKQYAFSDYYKSNAVSYVTADFRLSNGEYISTIIGTAKASRRWKKFETIITPPAGTVSVTVLHYLESKGYLATDDYYLGETDTPPPPPPPPPPSNNLILNPSLESGTVLPDNWNQGNWGTNNTTFIYPDAGHSGKGANINISSYTDGDAKWYFDDVNIIPGEKYTFSDFYQSTTATRVTGRFTNSDGTFLYLDLGYPSASSDWSQFSYSLIAPQNAVSLTVFHLIETVGWLGVDDFSLVKESTPVSTFSQGMVTLSFDDGWLSTYRNGIPVLNSYGIKSTQYIFTDALGTAGYITSAQMLDMQNQGHEIGAHSKTHSDLTTLTDAQLTDEILGSKQTLEALGANTITSFAYPFGEWNENIKNILGQSGYQGARTAMLQDGGFNYANQDPFLLKTVSVEIDTSVTEIQQWILEAINNRTWLILVYHQIENSGGQYSTTPQNLRSVANYISANNVKTVTIGQGLNKLTP